MLDATRLRVLVAVARHGSVTAAAHALNYAQPSVSHHIARLEAETGAKLVERAGRGVRLTDAGDLLARRAEEILGRLDAAEAELAVHVGLRQDRVRVAAFGSAIGTLVAAGAAALRPGSDGAGIELIQAEPSAALRLLREASTDVAVIFRYLRDGSEPDSLHAETATLLRAEYSIGLLLAEPVYLITPADREHQPDQAHRRSAADAQDEPDARAAMLASRKGQAWIATGERCAELLADLSQRAGFTPRLAARTQDSTAAQALVAAGIGVAILPGLALRLVRHPRIRAVKLPGVTREVRAIAYPAAPDATAVTRFVDAITAAAAQEPATAADVSRGAGAGCEQAR